MFRLKKVRPEYRNNFSINQFAGPVQLNVKFDQSAVDGTLMAEFEYRNKLEGWVEGVVDVFLTYFWTMLRMNFQPHRTVPLFKSPDDIPEMSSPSMYLILSYLVMCFLIRDVDFSDPIFLVNTAHILNALGALEAAKTAKVETLIASIFPVLMLLAFLIILTTAVLRLCGDNLEVRLLRRNYCFTLGGGFFAIGIISAGYYYLAKPVATTSWSFGLLIHTLTMFPLVGIIVPFCAIVRIGNPVKRIEKVRTIAIFVAMISIFLMTWMATGSFYLLDWFRMPVN